MQGEMNWVSMHSVFVQIMFTIRADLHLEAGPSFLGANCLKFQPIFGLGPASSPHYNKIRTRADFPICNGFRAKKPGRSKKSRKFQPISLSFHCHLYKMDE